MTEQERFDIARADLADGIRAALDDVPRLSPAARRFMSGDMDTAEARKLGYLREESR